MGIEQEIRDKLEDFSFEPSERIGQHFLTSETAIRQFADLVIPGVTVIEIGSGIGHLTEAIAEKASRVIGIEIDARLQPILNEVQERNPKIDFIYGDVLSVDLRTLTNGEEAQLVANLPFHITEALLQKLIDAPIENAVLIVGNQMARRMQIDDPDDLEFSRLSLLVQTFFETITVMSLGKDSFYPQPRTDAEMVVLTPKKNGFEHNLGQTILKNLFLSERKNPSIVKVIKDAFRNTGGNHAGMSKIESHRYERKQSKQKLRQMARNWQDGYPEKQEDSSSSEVEKLNLPNEILSKPFSRLDNQDLRTLTIALRRHHG